MEIFKIIQNCIYKYSYEPIKLLIFLIWLVGLCIIISILFLSLFFGIPTIFYKLTQNKRRKVLKECEEYHENINNS